MTPTSSSPSIVLLNPVAQSGKAAVTTDVEAKPDAGLNGFELLLSAMQQLPQKASTQIAAGDTKTQGTEKTGSESGKALPQLGTLLPPVVLPQPVPGEKLEATAATDTHSKADGKNKDTDKDADTAVTDLLSTVAATSAVIATPPPVAPQAAPKADNKSADPRGDTTVAADAAAASAAGAVLIPPDAKLGAQADAAQGAKVGDFDNQPAAKMPAIGARSVDVSARANVSNAADAGAAVAKDIQGSLKHSPESDFDALVKHFDATGTAPLATATIGDSASASASANQASRGYFNTAINTANNTPNTAGNTASVQIPVGQNGWSDAISDKVMWFSANKISTAEIHLNPPDLGPLQVRVSTQHDQMSVVFTSQHAAVRDALDQALPRLRDMMGGQGMHLLDVSVGGQSAQQQSQQQFSRNSADRGASFGGLFTEDTAETTVTNVTKVNTTRLLRSGVDAYA